MDDVWFGSNLTYRDVAVISQSLSLQGARLPPLIAVDRGSRVVLASRTLLRFFELRDGDVLTERLLAGRDPGARRLTFLCQNLTINGAPRLERLRFSLRPASEVVTFLCRRILFRDDQPLFVAAALGLRPEDAEALPTVASKIAEPVASAPTQRSSSLAQNLAQSGTPSLAGALASRPDTDPGRPASSPSISGQVLTRRLLPPVTGSASRGAGATSASEAAGRAATPFVSEPQTIQAIQAMLRTRWPSHRRLRFIWQTDADFMCTGLSSQLVEVVGKANADLVGRNLVAMAPRLDPSGDLGRALASRATWSGLGIAWPITDAGAAVDVRLGAVPRVDKDLGFEGFHGYGIIHLDAVRQHESIDVVERRSPAFVSDTVVAFPTGLVKGMSREDEANFQAIGDELRDQVGPETAAEPAVGENQLIEEPPGKEDASTAASATEASSPPSVRGAEVARNGLAVLDRLSVAVLVSRNDVPIFANRHMLDLTGFADEDALYAAGGVSYLFGGLSEASDHAETIGLRTREGGIVRVSARMQRLDWDSLPATLLTIQATDVVGAKPPSIGVGEIDPATLLSETDEMRDLRAILETATDGVAVIDARGDVVSLNRSGEALFGCDRSIVIGKPFLELFAVPNQSLAAEYLEGLKSNPTKSLLNDGREILVQAHEDGTIPVFMTLGRLGSADGVTSAARFCALFRDLTPWKKVERELQAARAEAERASALKSESLAMVSHEIRTPLNAIIGFAEAMMQERFGPLGSSRYKDDLRDIHASGLHVVSLVNDLLDLSKIEAGKMELTANPLDVNRIIGESVALMQPQANQERVIMRLSLAPSLPRVKADDRSLRQIILNVLSNAVKFNEPGGQVIVATTSTDDGRVVIRFRDTGTGMSESDLASAMEPFRQLDGSRSVGGTGLGLPLTKALAEANEASFTIRSEVAQGTMIEVSFPPQRVLAGQGNA